MEKANPREPGYGSCGMASFCSVRLLTVHLNILSAALPALIVGLSLPWDSSRASALPRAYLGILSVGSVLHGASQRLSWDSLCLGISLVHRASMRLSWDSLCLGISLVLGASRRLSWDSPCLGIRLVPPRFHALSAWLSLWDLSCAPRFHALIMGL